MIQNVRKILWSLQHVMRSDVCRRFTFGFTIEDADMRIWFCCRSMVVVTEPFNLITVSPIFGLLAPGQHGLCRIGRHWLPLCWRCLLPARLNWDAILLL